MPSVALLRLPFSYTLHLTPLHSTPLHSMSSLPSFVELMSSLGLEDGASSLPRTTPTFLRPRSHSNASSSSSDIDDEREAPRQQYATTGTYLFVPADHDRHDYTSLVDTDPPRVSRHCKGRYSPYSMDSVRIHPSSTVHVSPWFLWYDRSRGKQAYPHYLKQEKPSGYVSHQPFP